MSQSMGGQSEYQSNGHGLPCPFREEEPVMRLSDLRGEMLRAYVRKSEMARRNTAGITHTDRAGR